MKFKAEIDIMPLKELLDPQGKAVTSALHNMGLTQTENVRIGKHITIEIDASDEKAASQTAEQACKNLLANLVMENFSFKISKL